MLVFAPVALSSFYVGLAALEGHDIKAIKDEWREKFPGTWAVRTTFLLIHQAPAYRRSLFSYMMSVRQKRHARALKQNMLQPQNKTKSPNNATWGLVDH